MNYIRGLSDPAVETISGFNAGLAATLVAHPLDVVKTRLQGKYVQPIQNEL